jgi:hypothetical protein
MHPQQKPLWTVDSQVSAMTVVAANTGFFSSGVRFCKKEKKAAHEKFLARHSIVGSFAPLACTRGLGMHRYLSNHAATMKR